jgi:electron-transferring-flavoprotein dehydrogenase
LAPLASFSAVSIFGSTPSFQGSDPGYTPQTRQDRCGGNRAQIKSIAYRKPDGKLTFDKLTTLSFRTNRRRSARRIPHSHCGQPALFVRRAAQRYCPAGVYEIVRIKGTKI